MRKSALMGLGLVVMALMALGLVVLSSAGSANAYRLFHDYNYFLKREVVYVGIGILICVIVASTDYHCWKNHVWLTWLFYLTVAALLVYVFHFDAINGSQRWIKVFGYRFQPSEFAKIAVIITITVWLDKCGYRVERFVRGALVPVCILACLAVLVIREPDYGSTMVISLVAFLAMFVGGTRLLHCFPFAVLGAVGALLLLRGDDNRMRRLFDEKSLHQVKMSLVAIKNGGIFGVGLGHSIQKEAYLPEAHTDFIFAIGAEELGLFFTLAVIILFFLFLGISSYIASKASDRFGRNLVVGMSFLVFFQAAFNLCVVSNALPTKGMALPFFSYGGSNMMSACFAVGTILSVGIYSYREKRRSLARKVLVRVS